LSLITLLSLRSLLSVLSLLCVQSTFSLAPPVLLSLSDTDRTRTGHDRTL
jgi:hypothetical protein